jgi:hypothetical protein
MFQAWMVARTGNDDPEDAEIGLYDQEITVTQDLTLTAVWLTRYCTVTCDIGGEYPLSNYLVAYGDPVEQPEDPFIEGRRFLGWYLWKDGPDTRYDFTQPVTGDLTLIADWGYYVSFDPGAPATTGAMDTVIVRAGETWQLPDCDYAAEDYSFSQWMVIFGGSAAPGNPGDEIRMTSNLTVQAMWVLHYPDFGTPDFVLPAGTQTIEANAFEGAAMTVAEINSACTSIGGEAFKDCAGLRMIRIPANCAIGENAFSGCGKVYVYSAEGSPAEAYCSDPAHANCVFVQENGN